MKTTHRSNRVIRAALALAFGLGLAGLAHAKTFRVADQGDALSMDPHSLNESLQLSVTGNVYEALVGRNKDLSLAPALATSWKQTVWVPVAFGAQIPQALATSPSTYTLPGRAGLVVTRRNPVEA